MDEENGGVDETMVWVGGGWSVEGGGGGKEQGREEEHGNELQS